MTTLNGKYITLETLEKHFYEFAEFDAYMADFGKSTRKNYEMSVVEIIENETGEVVDYAHPVVISHKGMKFYELFLSEMESEWDLCGEEFSTIFDELELSNYPVAHQRATKG